MTEMKIKIMIFGHYIIILYNKQRSFADFLGDYIYYIIYVLPYLRYIFFIYLYFEDSNVFPRIRCMANSKIKSPSSNI